MSLLIALFVLAAAAYDVAERRPSFLLASVVVLADSLAHAARWVGVTDPAVGWLLLGVLGGGVIGAFVALRRGGRLTSRRPSRVVLAALGCGLLAADSYPPARGTRTDAAPAPPITIPVRMRVLAERVSVRASPSARADVVGRLQERTVLDVFRTNADGRWSYVEVRRGSRLLRGWVRRASLSGDTLDIRPTRVAREGSTKDSAGEVPSAADSAGRRAPDATPARAAGGAVSASASDAGPPAARDSGPAPARSDEPVRVDGARQAPDHSTVADVQTRLGAARTSAGAGDYAAALRALAAADEGAAIAASKYGQVDWVAALQRDAAAARAAVRGSCTTAAAAASRRGEVPPRCE